jgi:genome maintenance exonuclease 1
LTPEGKYYPSVTTVLSAQSKPGLDAWREKVGEKEAERIMKSSARRGTAVHLICENYLKNKDDYAVGHMPTNVFMFQSIKETLDLRLDNIWYQETSLYSDHLRTAGTVDCIAEFDGELSVIDFKTSRGQKRKDWITNYFQQEAFYAVAFEERTNTPIQQLVTIVATDEGDSQVFIENRDDHIQGFINARYEYAKLDKQS